MSDTPASHERACSMLARAKLNLSLRVLHREPSGYHQLDTLFCLIELADEIDVTLRRDGDVSLEVLAAPDQLGPPPDLGPTVTNLAHRAAIAFQRRAGITSGAAIRLVKRIPAGAGLGGGSSDTAAVLEALNQLHDAPLARAQLVQLAGDLGSDVPFFATRAAYAHATGRGERMVVMPPLPPAPVLLALPPIYSSTPHAYHALARRRDERHTIAATPTAEVPTSWPAVAAAAVNDFEDSVFEQHPLLGEIRAAMEEHAPLFARMTGSGSTLFAVFDDVMPLRAAHAALSAQFPQTRFVETRTATL